MSDTPRTDTIPSQNYDSGLRHLAKKLERELNTAKPSTPPSRNKRKGRNENLR